MNYPKYIKDNNDVYLCDIVEELGVSANAVWNHKSCYIYKILPNVIPSIQPKMHNDKLRRIYINDA